MNDIAKNEIKCDGCGILFKGIPETAYLNYYFAFIKDKTFNFDLIVCPSCGHEINPENFDMDLKDFIAKMEVENAHAGIESLKDHGFSFSYLERALGIPYRTFSRWKSNKQLSAVSKSYIDIIGNFPWIVDVAEKNFSPEIKFKNLLFATVHEWEKNADFDISPVFNRIKNLIAHNLPIKQNLDIGEIWVNDIPKVESQTPKTVTFSEFV